jgi:predicted ATPase/DNA-binding winged helix-turn-helix (wHTH) protein
MRELGDKPDLSRFIVGFGSTRRPLQQGVCTREPEDAQGVAAMTALTISRTVRFLDFEFFPLLRRLERRGEPIQLSSRALDILRVLTDRPGEVVSKQELLDDVWPHAVVDEGSIRFHMVALRRALGEGDGDAARVIVTVPGRGYAFVGDGLGVADEVSATPRESTLRTRLASCGWIVGRDDDVAEVLRRLDAQRCVSLVGPGGVGKSAVAAQAAVRWREAVGGVVTFVDLEDSAVDAPEAVAAVLAAALGVASPGKSHVAAVLESLTHHRNLLVLETCEAAIEGVAEVAAAVLAAAPQTCLLATSREALRVEGESIYPLRPLTAPSSDIGESAALAMTFPAVQLFVDRAANQGHFELQDIDAPIVASICRRLDGLPLAIEMAANRIEAFGVRGVLAQVSTDLALTWPGSRTACPRHQTLKATLDWSYDLLRDLERTALLRLSMFAAPFSLDEALAAGLPAAEMLQAISSLTTKSLLAVEEDATGRYRLLEVTRAYARAKSAAQVPDGAIAECGGPILARTHDQPLERPHRCLAA